MFQLSVSVSISILSGYYSFSLYDVLQYTYTYTFHCILIFRIFLIFLNLRFHMIWIFPTPILIAGDLILKYQSPELQTLLLNIDMYIARKTPVKDDVFGSILFTNMLAPHPLESYFPIILKCDGERCTIKISKRIKCAHWMWWNLKSYFCKIIVPWRIAWLNECKLK